MKFYTSVHARGDFIFLRGYSDNKRVQEKIKYKPYLFLPSKETTEYKNIKGQSLSRMDFSSIRDAKEFLQKYSDVSGFSIYGMSRFEYPFIHDTFGGTAIPYDASRIRVLNIDIEVASDDGFPDIQLASKLVTAISISINNKKVAFGYNEFVTKNPNVRYIKCRDENELLLKFLEMWKILDPDVVTGWNIEFFDIPYLINRIIRVLGKEYAEKLSPWGILREKNVIVHGRDNQVFHPIGVAVLDYLQLYKKFTYSQQESYRLDHIAFVELGERKLDYSEYENLNGLYKQNHQKFIEYNLRDVDLVDRLENKMRLIELVYAIAYDAGVIYEDALGSVLLWDVIIYNYLMNRKIVIPHNQEKKDFQYITGGFVKEPLIGMHNYVMSFDLTSLYPHLIMQYNISPDTFVTKTMIPSINMMLDGVDPRDSVSDKYRDCAIAANGCLYRKDMKGFLPALMELQFSQRDEYKKKMLEAKKRYEETQDEAINMEISRWNNAQMAKKIQLNSAYGALGNIYFRWFDADNAEAVTTSGQLAIQWIGRDMNSFMNGLLKTENEEYIIASDTDSIYINMGPLVNETCKDKTMNEIIDYLDTLGKKTFEPKMDESFIHLASFTNAYAQKMRMKREAIADKGIWKAKKMYILNVYDNEGVRYHEPTLKIMGIEAVRSSTPSACRENIKKALKLIMNTDEETVQKFIKDFRHEFYTLSFDDISFPRTVNGMDKYENAEKNIPIHCMGSLNYNKLLKKHNVTNKYQRIWNGDKIKFAYLKKPNPTHIHVIAIPSILPKEFGLDEYIDYDMQFERGFLQPLKSILDAIGWKPEKVNTIEEFFV